MSRALRLVTFGSMIGFAALVADGLLVGKAAAAVCKVEASGHAQPAVAAVDRLYTALLETMRRGSQLGAGARYRELGPVIDQVFNLPLMTRIAVGPRWSSLAPDQQHLLLDGFRRFTVATYARHFDRYAGERFEVDPSPRPIAGGVLVTTRLIAHDHRPVELDYVMRETDGAWLVVDVYAEGTISELARRRSEFASVLSRHGAEGLAARLVAKAQTLLNQPA